MSRSVSKASASFFSKGSQRIGGHSEGVMGRNQVSSAGRGLAESGGFSTEHTQTEGTVKEGGKKQKMK